MWTYHPQEQPKTAAVTLLLLLCSPAFQESAFCSSGRNAKISLASSGYLGILLCLKLPCPVPYLCLKPLQHTFTPPKESKIFSGAIKRCGCLCSTITVLCLEFMSFLCHPLVLMLIKLSSQERPVPRSFDVLHFCLPGGGSSLQTCR